MKRLFLLRHAKSSWDDPSIADFDRPLNERGIRAAPFMGELMASRGIVPDIILSSPAVRARKTAELVKESSGFAGTLAHDERIYEASLSTLVKVIAQIGDNLDSALIVGHNPGMEGAVSYLTGETHRMPTAALAGIQLRIDRWEATAERSGLLEFLLRPKEEMKKLADAI